MVRDQESERVYHEELKPWLPSSIIDCHVHVSLVEHCGPIGAERLRRNWAMEVDSAQSWQQLRDTYRLLFPEQEVETLAFGNVYREVNIEANNHYVGTGASDRNNRAWALLVTRPEWETGRIEEAMSRGFIGIKPYPDLVLQESEEVSIFDFVTHSQLAVVDKLGGIMMLHLPRHGRLGDPENIREVLEIHETYPAIKLILAHIGRAYCLPTAERGIPHFVSMPNIYFDTAANLNPDVFQYVLEQVGPQRLLFGSDLPITMMRGMREHVGERYINYTNGNYTWNTNRKSAQEEAKYTYFLYEELRALIQAVKRAGLGLEAMEQILYRNGAELLH